jgi:hypothetical protein
MFLRSVFQLDHCFQHGHNVRPFFWDGALDARFGTYGVFKVNFSKLIGARAAEPNGNESQWVLIDAAIWRELTA